ncbi:MAG: AAA family ATPase [Candidatus Lokiarchaeota archaeon]|nr:AAA family ATPase [Candidatus Lokiarchaeota archaeon]MBD3202639.1 AAA family ATPase [Candidatus Lokiarchaeota archaeon]
MNTNLNRLQEIENGRKVLRKDVHISKVILENFLSFQKDEVSFGDSRFIIIIGPNWSGKTSIYQAIKFALGSNERDERYQRWSDFIRHGEEHAIVELHIHVGNELIKIKRTVIKGQSPFFELQQGNEVDFKKVKVSEIQELIAKLHYNPENQFAFVSQGKIDSIKDLKPKELCKFLEEGIGLRGLREEILQQKDHVHNLKIDLKSLKTKKNSLNISLDLLRPKLERLEKKRKLLDEKQSYNDEMLWANRQKLLIDIVELAEKIKNLKADIKGIDNEKAINDEKIKKIIEKLTLLEEELNKLNESLGKESYKKEELVKKIKQWQNEKVLMKKELDDISERIDKYNKISQNLNSQKESVAKELKIINKEIFTIEKEISDLIDEQEKLVKLIEKNKQFLEEYDKVVKEKQDKLKKMDENRENIEDIENQINQLFQSFKDINHKLEQNKWFLENPSKNLLSELDIELQRTNTRLIDLEKEMKNLEMQKRRDLNELSRYQGSLRERKILLPTNINILKEDIAKRELNAKGPIIDYISYQDKLSYAIESVLGEKLLYSFVAKDWDTLDLLKRLKNKYNAYCNIYVPKKTNLQPLGKFNAEGVIGYLADLIKTNDLEIKKVIYSKIKNCLVVKDYRAGKELYKSFNFKGKCVTLKGEQIRSYKYVYETPYLKKLKGLLSVGTQKERVDELEEEISSLNDKITDLKKEASDLDKIQAEVYRKKETFNDLLYNFNQKERITTKKNNLYATKAKLEKENSALSDKISLLEKKISELESQQEPDFFEWNKRLKEIPSKLASLTQHRKKWKERLEENNKILNDVQKRINDNQNKIEIFQSEYNTKEDDFQKADKEAFEIYRGLEKVENEIEEIKTNIKRIRTDKSNLSEEKSKLDKKNIEFELRSDQERIKLTRYQEELTSINNDLERINNEIGERIKQNQIELRSIEEIKKDIYRVDKQLLKYYDVDESIIVERDQIISSLKKIAKNQKSLEDDINAAIITENKLEDTYYNKFKEVLETLEGMINNKFKKSEINVYCSLSLIGDFKELGVDIKAATSNKPLISCTALSGGQVSMVSIGLILALQEMKPSPLCMFDEPAMFLDDKNAEIAYELIKNTLEENPVQMLMFLPKSSNVLYKLADKLIGVARTGKNEVSTILKPKIIEKTSK